MKLADGSTATLGDEAEVQVVLSEDQRLIILRNGKAAAARAAVASFPALGGGWDAPVQQ